MGQKKELTPERRAVWEEKRLRLRQKSMLPLEQRLEREQRRFKKVIGKEITGGTSLLVSLRYLMGGGEPFFGLYGATILDFFEHLYTDRDFYEWYRQVPHEQIGGHAAAGFAASTGKVGFGVFTSGPGIANTVSACADAMKDSLPIVYIAGNVAKDKAKYDAFQGLDVKKVFKAVSKKVFYVTNTEDIPSALFKAYNLARSGRPGPVIVDITQDALLKKAKFSPKTADLESILKDTSHLDGISLNPFYNLKSLWTKYTNYTNRRKLRKLTGLISKAKRPIIYVGRGVKSAEASEEAIQFAYKTGIPVVYSLKGKGAFPDLDERCIGPIGMHGSAAANYTVDEADLVIALGTKFSDRTTGNPELFAHNAYIAHLDIDPKGIGPKKRQPNMVVEGDVKNSLTILNDLVSTCTPPDLREWYEQIKDLREKFPLKYEQKGDIIKPQFVIQTLSDLLKNETENVIYVTDVGQHQMWAMQYLQTSNPLGFLTSGGLGIMGYGLPAALGAKLGNPDKTVVVVTGDASFRQTTQTLEMYSQYGLDIKVFVIDNEAEGMVSQHFRLGSAVNPKLKRRGRPGDIASIARGYDVEASTVKDPNKVYASIALALQQKGPQLVDFKVDSNEGVWPFIPAGKTVKDMLLAPPANYKTPTSHS